VSNFLISEEVRLLISSTDACLKRLRIEIEDGDSLDIKRIKTIIAYQVVACDRMRLVVNEVLGDS